MPQKNDFKKYSTEYYQKLLEAEKKKHKKPEKNTKKNSLAKEILVRILDATGAYDKWLPDIRSCQGAYITGGYGLVAEIEDAKERKYLRNEILRLKKERFIKERKTGDQLELCLTEKGKKAALRHQILKCNNLLEDRYYVVVFDIPETERKTRLYFRLFLKEAGFIKLQQSVWVTQKEVLESLTELIRIAKAERWIQIISATAITNFSFE